jgi:hypothetical protein
MKNSTAPRQHFAKLNTAPFQQQARKEKKELNDAQIIESKSMLHIISQRK